MKIYSFQMKLYGILEEIILTLEFRCEVGPRTIERSREEELEGQVLPHEDNYDRFQFNLAIVRGPVDTVGSVAEFLSNNIPNTRAPDHTLYLSYSRVMGVPYTSSAEPLEGEEPTILPARMEFVWRPLRRKVARAATPAQPPPRVRTFAIGAV
jgi:hypothetical protein